MGASCLCTGHKSCFCSDAKPDKRNVSYVGDESMIGAMVQAGANAAHAGQGGISANGMGATDTSTGTVAGSGIGDCRWMTATATTLRDSTGGDRDPPPMKFWTTSQLHAWWYGTGYYEGVPRNGGIEGLMTISPEVFRAWKSQLNSKSAKRFSRYQQVKIGVANYLQ